MKIILILALLLTTTISGYADIYVVYDRNSKEVISVSNENDCVVQDNMELDVVEGIGLSDLMLASHPTMYKWQGKEFKPNMPKIQAREQEELETYEKQQEYDMINERMKKNAMDALKAEGKTFKYKHLKEEE